MTRVDAVIGFFQETVRVYGQRMWLSAPTVRQGTGLRGCVEDVCDGLAVLGFLDVRAGGEFRVTDLGLDKKID